MELKFNIDADPVSNKAVEEKISVLKEVRRKTTQEKELAENSMTMIIDLFVFNVGLLALMCLIATESVFPGLNACLYMSEEDTNYCGQLGFASYSLLVFCLLFLCSYYLKRLKKIKLKQIVDDMLLLAPLMTTKGSADSVFFKR